MSPSSYIWEENSPFQNLLFFLPIQLGSSSVDPPNTGPWPFGWVPDPKLNQCEFFLRILKMTTVEYSFLVTELGAKWKKADFRKEEQSQSVEAKLPSRPGGVPLGLLLNPAAAFLLLDYLESIHPTLLCFFTCAASSAISVTCNLARAD